MDGLTLRYTYLEWHSSQWSDQMGRGDQHQGETTFLEMNIYSLDATIEGCLYFSLMTGILHFRKKV